MLENIKLAFQGIWAHKMRSFLTMLGVIIGIASIMTIVSTIKGTNEQTRQNLIGSGNNALELVYTVEGGDPSAQTGVQAPISFPKDLMESIEDLSVIKSCAPYYSMQTQSYGESVYYGNTNLQGYLIGTTNDYLSVFGYQVQRGRAFVERDFKNHQKVALIDEAAASALFGIQDPVGKVLEIYGEPFEVVGVLQETAKRELKFNSAEEYMEYLQNVGYQDYGYSGKVLIPQVTWPIVAQYDATPNLAISARSTDDMVAAGRQSLNLLNEEFGLSEGAQYTCDKIKAISDSLNLTKNTTQTQLLWVACISLLVGGIGVMNIMLVSVTERTREIGLKKAIGAKKARILGQFLTEAAVLTCLGGLLGVVTGIVLARVVSSFSGAPVAISVPYSAAAVLLSILIGVVSGLVPAMKAANLNPIDALQQE